MSQIVFVVLLVSNVSCHTTARWFGGDDSELSSEDKTAITDRDLEEVKPMILSLQIQYGRFPPKNQRIYSDTHNLHCYQDGALKACFLRLILDESPFLSEPVQLSRRLSEKLLDSFHQQRGDLRNVRQLFADLTCDHVNESMPPFERKMEFCRQSNARNINEFYLQNEDAISVKKLLNTSSTFQRKEINPELICETQKSNSCVMSATSSSGSQTALAVPKALGKRVVNQFMEYYRLRWAIQTSKSKGKLLKISQIKGRINCSPSSNVIKKEQFCIVTF